MKKIITLFSIFAMLLIIPSCKVVTEDPEKEYEPINLTSSKYEHVSEEDFNRDLFYMNTLEFEVADPTVIYAEHGEGAGYFYAFGTSDLIDCHGVQCWRSSDLANWEYTGVALQPDPTNTWGFNNYWAPEIIYDDEYGLYFLFYNADDIDNPSQKHLSVAYSENVMGPYVIPNGIKNANGDKLEADEPVIDFVANQDKLPDNIQCRAQAIDASPFIDPQTGKRYLYWSWYDGYQEIFGMEMVDWFTPKYETVTKVTELNRVSVGSDEQIFDGDPALNEGPFVYYKDGTYFMTFSVFPYTHSQYQVRLAVSDNPLTGFKKLPVDDGGVILSTDPTWRHITSAGHHCFVPAGDSLYIAYHTFLDRSSIQYGRALAVDEVEFIKNSKGQLTMHTNGPTYSLQPIPSVITGYSNVAKDAKVTAEGLATWSSADYLTDNIIKTKESDLAVESEFTGPAKITFEFEKAVNLKAIMVYNSYFYDTSFVQIDSAELEYVVDEKGNTNIAKLGSIPFDFDWNAYNSRDMEPGGAAIAEFEDVPVKKVTLTINFKDFAISEIKLLGKEAEANAYKSEFASTYEYNNTIEINNFVNEGTYLGGTEFYEATYGWDFSHDGKEEGSYVTTTGVGDSYAYFKDVVTNKFYAEGYISTFAGSSYNKDLFPKFGMVVRNDESCMFFYIDAANQYTNKYVGYTQSKFGNSGDWDWSATEEIKPIDITYKNNELNLNENFVKIAILRDGEAFYLLMNDEVIFTSNSLRGLGANDMASVGFLGFNTPMVIKNYSITTDAAEITAVYDKLIK